MSDSANTAPGASPPSNFIRNMIARDIADGKHDGRVHTRFPPEPNGYLHIGHAKSICLNFGVAAENHGHCNLRFDDTNPVKESQEYVDAIKENINWLGFTWHGEVRYSSSYFAALYEFARQLIDRNLAYVCSLNAEQAREYRGTLTEPGRNSPDRERPPAESLALLEKMKAGEFADGELSLRAKIDMASPNITLRDPVLYRIRHVAHHQTGTAWCIYPTYDYTHCLSDAIEGITHSLCTLEFEDHRPLYDWILHNLEPESLRQASDLANSSCRHVLPEQTEFAKLKLNYTVLGKRKLKEMVDTGIVQGWDDPRMPTLAGMRRRGITPAAIRNFCERVGVSRSESVVDMGMLEHAIREDLDKTAPRALCVLDPVKVVIANIDVDHSQQLSLPNHPANDAMGRREVPFTRELFIDRSDFVEQPPAGFKRLIPGGEVRLRGAYVIRCDSVEKDGEGNILQLNCTADLETLGKKPQGRKVKGVIHWVSAGQGIPATVRLYDRLFLVENPEAREIEDYRSVLNPDSMCIIDTAIIEPSVLATGDAANQGNDGENNSVKSGTGFQFEREGYFCLDTIDSEAGKPVFNRIITLRDSWSN